LLKQPQYEPLPVEKQVAIIYAGTVGHLDDVPVSELRAFETELYKFLETRYANVLTGIREKKQLDDQLKAALDAAVREFGRDFATRRASAA
jgi:F-type H+-transporting ATPase subunit alpha